jgi:hypothetical protein
MSRRAWRRVKESSQTPWPDRLQILAEKVLSTEAWAYYSSAGDDEVTKQENEDAFKRYFFRPRILRDVSPGLVDISTTILGSPSSAPFFIAPSVVSASAHACRSPRIKMLMLPSFVELPWLDSVIPMGR